jgi:hypothetical protein
MTNPDDRLARIRAGTAIGPADAEWLLGEVEQLRGNLSLAEEGLAAATQEVQRLQHALSFWMPCVPDPGEVMVGACERLMDDAMLLAGHDGPDEKSAEALGWIKLQPPASEPRTCTCKSVKTNLAHLPPMVVPDENCPAHRANAQKSGAGHSAEYDLTVVRTAGTGDPL